MLKRGDSGSPAPKKRSPDVAVNCFCFCRQKPYQVIRDLYLLAS